MATVVTTVKFLTVFYLAIIPSLTNLVKRLETMKQPEISFSQGDKAIARGGVPQKL
jgi:hypothetical protein